MATGRYSTLSASCCVVCGGGSACGPPQSGSSGAEATTSWPRRGRPGVGAAACTASRKPRGAYPTRGRRALQFSLKREGAPTADASELCASCSGGGRRLWARDDPVRARGEAFGSVHSVRRAPKDAGPQVLQQGVRGSSPPSGSGHVRRRGRRRVVGTPAERHDLRELGRPAEHLRRARPGRQNNAQARPAQDHRADLRSDAQSSLPAAHRFSQVADKR